MGLNPLYFHRAECTQSHMQSHTGNLYPPGLHLSQQRLRKMQSRRRRRRRSFIFGIHGLIPVFVRQLMRNIGRQRHFAQTVQYFFPNTRVPETDQPVALFHHIHHFPPEPSVPKYQLCAGPGFFARLYQSFPQIRFSPGQQQYLNGCACIRLHTIEPGRDNPRIIQYKTVARTEKIHNLPKCMMSGSTGPLIQYQQPGTAPIRQRILGNQFFRQHKVIIGCPQTFHILLCLIHSFLPRIRRPTPIFHPSRCISGKRRNPALSHRHPLCS